MCQVAAAPLHAAHVPGGCCLTRCSCARWLLPYTLLIYQVAAAPLHAALLCSSVRCAVCGVSCALLAVSALCVLFLLCPVCVVYAIVDYIFCDAESLRSVCLVPCVLCVLSSLCAVCA